MNEPEQQVLAEMQEDPDQMNDTSKKEKTGEDKVSFGDAVAELEAILHRIESEEIDIDQLASQLKRATALLEICRGRVRKAEAEVTQVVQALTPEAVSTADSKDS